MADKYQNFGELFALERDGEDYQIILECRGSHFLIMAPHGGKIEPGTSEIVKAVAGTDLSFYCFEGIKRRVNSDLHVTSHRYDEPKAIDMVGVPSRMIT